jgi:uncharacterized glyoxalase superfamily protein PhnB
MVQSTSCRPDGATYRRALTGIGFNLLGDDMFQIFDFLRQVLTIAPVYDDTDFAILRHDGIEFMLHSDASYHRNPFVGLLEQGAMRGNAAELRLYGVDPDTAASQAQSLGHYILQEAGDKPHGLREAYILDDNGHIWVPSIVIHHAV